LSKILVLAEKPSVGRDLARVLNCSNKGNGFFEGDRYVVTWALGHLVTLADPEIYDEKYKAWKLEDLPMLPPSFKTIVIKKTGKQFQAVKTQLNRKDVNEVIIATDAGREGELVARWIIEKAHVRKPIKRLWISSVTDKAIQEGFRQLKDGKAYESLYASAVARAEADWVVGMNATRALTTKYNAQLSCGRVQTPTVGMIAQREEEIRQFVPKTYYGLSATTNGLKWTWQDARTNQTRTFNEEANHRNFELLKGHSLRVDSIEKVTKKKLAPGLYDLTELQRDAHHKFGYSAKDTLSTLQRLYEQYKVVTYPRTDSRFLSEDLVDTLKDRIKAVSAQPYTPLVHTILRKPLQTNKSFVNDAKVTDHHAIIPTEQTVMISKLSDKERKIYDLIIRRFLAVFFPPFVYEQTTVTGSIKNEKFVAKGKTITSKGWKAVYDHQDEEDKEEDQEDQLLPVLEIGSTLPVDSFLETKGETKPPARFNEGTLLSAMENPGKFLGSEKHALSKTLGETGGLGTVATRADVIEKLFNTFLIEKKGKDLFVTAKGKQLLELVPEELKSPALTAEWEQKLSAIASGKLSKDAFIHEMKAYAKTVVQEITLSSQTFKHDNMTGTKCPDCGKLMLEVNGKKGKMLVCQDRECGHRKNISKQTNARCPNCHKRMELRGEGDGQLFFCSCGHREKLSSFQKRRESSKSGKASKQDVNKYLKNQDREEEPLNNPFADALAKLKLK
jgi:DNA topoisomerase-3